MPKAEKGSIKDLAKRMKSKGLQKLKFYCQMCEKQCRDANGFKCHLTSDSHLRSMKLFSENSKSILYQNSAQFEKCFLDNLRMRHSTAQVNANQVYQQVISDKQHVHMNGTFWSSLSGFVQYLGKTGKCQIEETERGWMIRYINRDVDKMQREAAQQKRQAAELQAEAELQQRIQVQREQAALALDRAGGVLESKPTALEADHAAVQLSFSTDTAGPKRKKQKVAAGFLDLAEDADKEDEDAKAEQKIPARAPPVVETATTTSQAPAPQQQEQQEQPWLYKNILVRIIHKQLADGAYFRKKAFVEQVIDAYTAQVVTDDDAAVTLRLDQADLETVVPKKPGERVRILRGQHRGSKAVVLELDKQSCTATVELKNKTKLERVSYDDFSRLT